jgi:sarcosine oxidase, subunit gamma
MSASPTPVPARARAPATVARFGMKGSDAPTWLSLRGIAVPEGPNRIAHWRADAPAGKGRCLRLGHGEFLVELDEATPLARALVNPPSSPAAQAWTLLRSDHCLVLDGPHWHAVLAAICSYDFSRFDHEPDQVVMTLLAGISVTLAREPGPQASLRLWCDASYADYLQHCLHTLTCSAPEPTGDLR